MTTRAMTLRRRFKAAERNVHGLWQILKAVVSTDHPLLAHLIPIRRCNLACTYCNEFDDFSKPVPAEQMLRREGSMGALRTSQVNRSDGRTPLPPPPYDTFLHTRTNPTAYWPSSRSH